jgi:hypothetical protein
LRFAAAEFGAIDLQIVCQHLKQGRVVGRITSGSLPIELELNHAYLLVSGCFV